MTVGERIKTLRKQKGYTQGDVATQLNMSRQAVAKWEQNVCEPNVNCLIAMAELFEVDLNYLITGKVEEKPNPWEKSQKLLKSLSLASVLVAAGLSLIFTFLIGFKSNVLSGADFYIYHFFGESLKTAREVILASSAVESLGVAIYVEAVICAILAGVTLFLVPLFAAITVVRLVKNIKKTSQKSPVSFALLTVTCYLFGAGSLYFLNFTKKTFNGATIAGLIICGIFTTVAGVLYYVSKGKELLNKRAATSCVLAVVGIVLSVTLFVLSIKVGATYTYDNGFIASVRATFLNFFYSNLPFKYTAESEPVINATLILTIILTIFNILGIAIIVKNCYNKLNNVTKDKNEGLFTPILMLLISALVLLLAIIQSNKQMDALTFLNSVVANNVSANLTLPILVLVFATLNLAVSVINKIFKNKIFIKENSNEL